MISTMPDTIPSISHAKAHFSAIAEAASEGRVFVVCRAGKPIITISRYEPKAIPRKPGALEGKIRMADDFDEWPNDMLESLGMK